MTIVTFLSYLLWEGGVGIKVGLCLLYYQLRLSLVHPCTPGLVMLILVDNFSDNPIDFCVDLNFPGHLAAEDSAQSYQVVRGVKSSNRL